MGFGRARNFKIMICLVVDAERANDRRCPTKTAGSHFWRECSRVMGLKRECYEFATSMVSAGVHAPLNRSMSMSMFVFTSGACRLMSEPGASKKAKTKNQEAHKTIACKHE